jgi:hypothetical protein
MMPFPSTTKVLLDLAEHGIDVQALGGADRF